MIDQYQAAIFKAHEELMLSINGYKGNKRKKLTVLTKIEIMRRHLNNLEVVLNPEKEEAEKEEARQLRIANGMEQ